MDDQKFESAVIIPSASQIRQNVLRDLIRHLRALDFAEASRRVNGDEFADLSALPVSAIPYIHVTPSDGSALTFLVDCRSLFQAEVRLTPNLLDQDDAEGLAAFQACIAIVRMMQSATETNEYEHGKLNTAHYLWSWRPITDGRHHTFQNVFTVGSQQELANQGFAVAWVKQNIFFKLFPCCGP